MMCYGLIFYSFLSHSGTFPALFFLTFLPNFVPVGLFKRLKPLILCHFSLPWSYSHSMLAGGFEVISYTTRLIPSTSATIRWEVFSRTSYGIRANSADKPSLE